MGLRFATFGLFGLLLVGGVDFLGTCGYDLWVDLVLGVDIVWCLSVFRCLTVGGVVWNAVLVVGFARVVRFVGLIYGWIA